MTGEGPGVSSRGAVFLRLSDGEGGTERVQSALCGGSLRSAGPGLRRRAAKRAVRSRRQRHAGPTWLKTAARGDAAKKGAFPKRTVSCFFRRYDGQERISLHHFRLSDERQ